MHADDEVEESQDRLRQCLNWLHSALMRIIDIQATLLDITTTIEVQPMHSNYAVRTRAQKESRYRSVASELGIRRGIRIVEKLCNTAATALSNAAKNVPWGRRFAAVGKEAD